MSRRALVLAAHGSRHEVEVNTVIRTYASRIAALGLFDEVTAAFHQGHPQLASVIDEFDVSNIRQVTVVPVMISEGYYSEVVLPRDLVQNQRIESFELCVRRPIGTHPSIIELLLKQALALARRHGLEPAHTGLALVGHGTPLHPTSRRSTEEAAGALRKLDRFGGVEAFFLVEPPGVEMVLQLLPQQNVLVLPFLIAPGPQARRNIPARLGLGDTDQTLFPIVGKTNGRFVAIDAPVGANPAILEVLALAALGVETPRSDSVRCASSTRSSEVAHLTAIANETSCDFPSPSNLLRPVDRKRLRLGTRPSRMACWQANQVAGLLRNLGVSIEIVEIATTGDRVQDCPIAELPGDAPFVDDLEAALATGEIDLAVHCLKDLPVRFALGESTVAILPRQRATEALVSRDRRSLANLPPASAVGTSSPRRAAQLLSLRSDLLPRPIRGPVEKRIALIREGRVDAVILATAGLERLGLLAEIAEEFSLDVFLPAPGQGAMAIRVRADDAMTADLCRRLDDRATRLAVTAEMAFLKPFEFDSGVTVAAYAAVHSIAGGEGIRLQARLLSPDGRNRHEVILGGDDPFELAQAALTLCGRARLQRQGVMA